MVKPEEKIWQIKPKNAGVLSKTNKQNTYYSSGAEVWDDLRGAVDILKRNIKIRSMEALGWLRILKSDGDQRAFNLWRYQSKIHFA